MASTLGGNPVSTAAAGAALEVFRAPGTYERLHGLGDYLRQGLRRALRERQVVAQVIGHGPLAQVVFPPAPVRDYRPTQQGDAGKGRAPTRVGSALATPIAASMAFGGSPRPAHAPPIVGVEEVTYG